MNQLASSSKAHYSHKNFSCKCGKMARLIQKSPPLKVKKAISGFSPRDVRLLLISNTHNM